MTGSKALPWVVGTVFLAVLVLLFSWFVVIAPMCDTAAQDRQSASQQELQNDMLATRNAKLAQEFEHLDDYREQLQESRVQIPTSIDQPTLSRELDALATKTGVRISDISFSSSMKLRDALPKSPAGSTGDDPDEDDDDTASGPSVPADMYAVPLQVTVLGAPKDTRAFVHALQSGGGRLYLVTGLQIDRQNESGSSADTAAVHDGDDQMVVTGLTYLLTADESTDDDAGGEDRDAAD